MALIFADDGEGGTSAYAWTETNSTAHDVTAKDGSYGVIQSAGTFYAKKVLSATYTELFFSAFFRMGNATSLKLLSWYSAATTELGSVRWNSSSNKFEIYTGASTLQATGTVVQQPVTGGGGWFNLNIRVLLHASTGEIAVRHEGATSADVTFTGNTLPSGTNMDAFQLFTSGTSHSAFVDNFWVNDTSGSVNNSWPGVMRAFTQFPTGKSATNDAWTADSGTNKYDRVNEQPTNTSSYIYSETNGQKQGLTYAAPSAQTGTIAALVINDVAEKISTGGLKQGVRMSSTDYASSTKTLKTTVTRESQLQHILEVRPTDSAAWDFATDNPESYLEKTA